MSNILDVSKGNKFPFITTILSIPFIILALLFLVPYVLFMFVACLIGRRAAFKFLLNVHDKLFKQ